MAGGKAFEAIVSIAGKVDPSLARSLNQAQKEAEGFSKKLGAAAKIGAAGVAAMGAAAIAGTKKAIDAASEYQTNFAKTTTLLTGNQEELDAYSKSILQLSNDTGIAAGELTDTVYNAISAGVSQEDAVSFANKAAQLASGGFTDSATAVDVLTTALNAYGLESDKAGQISDYLITTQNLGKTTVNELASSVGKVIPIASAYGVEMDNLSTAYAQLTAGGIATAVAGTYLKGMLNELGDSGSTVSSVLKSETGMSFAELTESGKSLGDIMNILGESVNGDAGAFNELWSSSEAGVGALSLFNSGADAYNTTLKAMQESSGATQTAYEKMTDTFSHKVDVIKNLAQNTFIDIGQQMLPGLSEGLDEIIPVIENISSNVIPQITSKIGEIMPVVKPIFLFIMSFLSTTGTTVMNLVGEIWQVMQDIMSDVNRMFGGGLGIALMVMCGQVKEAFSDISNSVMHVITQLQPIFQILKDQIAVIIVSIIDSIRDGLPFVMTILKSVMGIISQIISVLVTVGASILSVVMPAARKLFEAIQSLRTILLQVLAQVLPILQSWLSVLMPILKLVAKIIGVILGGAIANAINLLTHIINVVRTVLSVFSGVISFFQGFIASWISIWQSVSGAVESAFIGLVGIVKAPINTIIGMVNGVIDKINSVKITVPNWVPKPYGGKSFSIGIPNLPMLASGGLTQGPSIAGEDGQEMVISFNPKYRDSNIDYWKRAGQMLGVVNESAKTGQALASDEGYSSILEHKTTNNNSNYVIEKMEFNPTIIIRGDAKKEDIKEAIDEAKEDFFDRIDEWWDDKTGGGNYEPVF